ncbi:DNA internalization-related competence protein ComEC/Rec2 [Tepidiforma sp.]|uniref:DNA internalization-related competence protein ComEC/Rec2 n=1 Tax=Tepidiforma sp. TaxID=2682230 RepID=UPI002ADE57F3|nr:DNA internalization-related competence protein ComEC/Rec2 [Tepidiforma sp.]
MVLIVAGAAWLAGLFPVAAWGAPWWMGSLWTGCAATGVLARHPQRWRLAAAGVVLAGAAGWRMDAALGRDPAAVASFLGREVVIWGTVVSEPDQGDLSTSYDIRVDRLEADGEAVTDAGAIRATLGQYTELLPGDRVRLEGDLEPAPVFDGFDYRAYLQRRGIAGTMLYPRVELEEGGGPSPGRVLTEMRLALDGALQRALPEPEASLGAGIAFGRDDGLSRDLKAAFNESGLRHLVAVSGSNLVLVSAVGTALAVATVGRRWALLPAGLLLALYVLLAGFEPSVVRAAIMAAVLLGGELVGRPQAGMPALALAAIVMTGLEPGLMLDAGFQLSVSATAGLLAFGGWFRAGFEKVRRTGPGEWLPGWVGEVAAISCAATLATLPIQWAQFDRVSLIGPLANVAVQPAVVLAFWASLLTALLGAVSPGLGWLAGLAAYYPLRYVVEAAEWAASVPGASAAPETAGGWLPLTAGAVVAAAGWLAYARLAPVEAPSRRAESRAKAGQRLLAGGALAALAVVVVSGMGREEGLRIDVLDVGQGDAILLTTPAGRQVLVDGGPSGLRLARELGAVMPHWDRSIELVIISHPQEDHIGGLPALAERFRVGPAVSNGDSNRTATAALTAQRFEAVTAGAGDSFELDGVVFRVLWPRQGDDGDLNERSLVIEVSYEGTAILLTGDIEAGAQQVLAEAVAGRVDILKVPHHGSRTSDPNFLRQTGARVAVISVGAGNRYGHPHPNTLAALEGAAVFRTDLDGRITIRVHDGEVRVATQR